MISKGGKTMKNYERYPFSNSTHILSLYRDGLKSLKIFDWKKGKSNPIALFVETSEERLIQKLMEWGAQEVEESGND